MPERPILIVGGGIAGLAAALATSAAGRAAIILERAQKFSEIGAGLQLGPNAARALMTLGAWDAVLPHAFSPSAIVIRDGLSGAVLQRIALGAPFEARFGERYRVIHRADLLSGLLETADAQAGISLRTGIRVEKFASSRDSVTAGGEIGSALIGADGIHSAIREVLLRDGPPASFATAHYRALIAIGPADPDAVCLWLCPGGHVVHYPVSAGTRLNIIATTAETIAGEGWSLPASPAHLKSYFSSATPALGDMLSRPLAWTRWPAAIRPPSGRLPRGLVTLAGDAAQPTLPYLAQGAAMALEDAAAIGRCLTRHPTPEGALRDYEARRRVRRISIAAASRRLAPVYHASGPFRLLRNALLRATSSERLLDRMAWIYAYDPGRP